MSRDKYLSGYKYGDITIITAKFDTHLYDAVESEYPRRLG